MLRRWSPLAEHRYRNSQIPCSAVGSCRSLPAQGHPDMPWLSHASESPNMKTLVRCGSLFTGQDDEPRKGEAIVFDDTGELLHVGPEAKAPRRAEDDRLIDHSGSFVMPGLIDVHTHLAYGNAKSEAGIDLC